MLKQTIANHSEPLKLDLQFFSEFEEEAILPDDFVAETNPFEEQDEQLLDEEGAESGLDTIETEEVDPSLQEEEQLTPEQLRFKVKFNHEEQELGYDEAVPLIQKGMNYDKLQERLGELETDPRLSFVEDLAKEQGMDVNEFLDAVRQSREQQSIDDLVQQNIPEEYAREMLENRKFREQLEQEKQQKEEEEKKNSEFTEFFEVFQQANERGYDPSKDEIPQEVWDIHNQGTPLKYAYMQHHNQQLKSQLQTFKQNEKNTKRAPVGSITSHGGDAPSSEDQFLKGFDS